MREMRRGASRPHVSCMRNGSYVRSRVTSFTVLSSRSERLAPDSAFDGPPRFAVAQSCLTGRSPTRGLSHRSRTAVGDGRSALDHHVDTCAVREDRQVVQRVAIDQQ
jgi:hypothetical protein